MTVDSLVESIDTYQRRPPAAHIYAGPFIVVHSIWFFYWNYYLGVQDYWEIGCIITGVLAILQVNFAWADNFTRKQGNLIRWAHVKKLSEQVVSVK